MKKIIILSAIFWSIAAGCNECKTPDMSKYTVLTEAAVHKMAQHYLDIVGKHSDLVILQIKLENPLLKQLVCSIDTFQLMPIANEKNEVSMALQLDKDGKSTYYDLQKLFRRPLCPPPPACHMDTLGNPVPHDTVPLPHL